MYWDPTTGTVCDCSPQQQAEFTAATRELQRQARRRARWLHIGSGVLSVLTVFAFWTVLMICGLWPLR